MLIKITACITKQTVKRSVIAGRPDEMITEVVMNKEKQPVVIDRYINTKHVVALDVHPSGMTIISLLAGGCLVPQSIDEVAQMLSKPLFDLFPVDPANDEA